MLVLKELAYNSPTLFYVHVSTFVDIVWVALRDQKVFYHITYLVLFYFIFTYMFIYLFIYIYFKTAGDT